MTDCRKLGSIMYVNKAFNLKVHFNSYKVIDISFYFILELVIKINQDRTSDVWLADPRFINWIKTANKNTVSLEKFSQDK